MPDRALEGIRVIELGEFVSAGYCGKLLSDLGAEVIKVEHPDAGDEARRYGPFPEDIPDPGRSGIYAYLSTNKLSITLDTAALTGASLFRRLVAEADVLIENTQPGVLEGSGLGYASLAAINPRLVMTSITAFGRSGPYSGYKGYDLTAWHGSGIGQAHLGHPDKVPLRGQWQHSDHWGAIGGATATMLALHAREVIGEGQHVDMSQAEMMAAMIMGYQKVTVYHQTGEATKRTFSRGGHAPSGLYRCRDGHIFIFAFEDHHWKGFVKAMGDPDWAHEPLFQVPAWERAAYGAEINALMQPWLDKHDKGYIFEVLQKNRVPSGPVNGTTDLLDNPHLLSRGFFTETDSPSNGRMDLPGRPYLFSETPWAVRRPAPTLGQDNEHVYCGRLGLRRGDLADLRRARVI